MRSRATSPTASPMIIRPVLDVYQLDRRPKYSTKRSKGTSVLYRMSAGSNAIRYSPSVAFALGRFLSVVKSC